jgi:hypothetical protein
MRKVRGYGEGSCQMPLGQSIDSADRLRFGQWLISGGCDQAVRALGSPSFARAKTVAMLANT